jgi:hypothetical protein
MDRSARVRTAIVEQSIRAAAREGNTAAQRTVDRVLRPEAETAEERAAVRLGGDATAMAAASERIRGRTTVGELSLSQRFHRQDAAAVEGMRSELQASIRAGESLQRSAERILSTDTPIVEVPAYVAELAAAAQSGDVEVFERAVARFRASVERLGTGPEGGPGFATVRSAGQQLEKELRRAMLAGEHLDPIVDRWLLERARHQARVIARHETVEAFRDGYRKTTEEEPYVKGYRWQLSPSHPRPDVCDLLAAQDLYGLGPGGYPADAVPVTPHPLCTCFQTAIIDRDHFRRELAQRRGLRNLPPEPWKSGRRETAAEWLAQQPEEFRRRLLGPTRAQAFDLDPTAVITAQGTIRSAAAAAQATGLPFTPRVRRRGPSVDVAPIVAADRARMVQQLPTTDEAAAEQRGRVDSFLQGRGLPAVGAPRPRRRPAPTVSITPPSLPSVPEPTPAPIAPPPPPPPPPPTPAETARAARQRVQEQEATYASTHSYLTAPPDRQQLAQNREQRWRKAQARTSGTARADARRRLLDGERALDDLEAEVAHEMVAAIRAELGPEVAGAFAERAFFGPTARLRDALDADELLAFELAEDLVERPGAVRELGAAARARFDRFCEAATGTRSRFRDWASMQPALTMFSDGTRSLVVRAKMAAAASFGMQNGVVTLNRVIAERARAALMRIALGARPGSMTMLEVDGLATFLHEFLHGASRAGVSPVTKLPFLNDLGGSASLALEEAAVELLARESAQALLRPWLAGPIPTFGRPPAVPRPGGGVAFRYPPAPVPLAYSATIEGVFDVVAAATGWDPERVSRAVTEGLRATRGDGPLDYDIEATFARAAVASATGGVSSADVRRIRQGLRRAFRKWSAAQQRPELYAVEGP